MTSFFDRFVFVLHYSLPPLAIYCKILNKKANPD